MIVLELDNRCSSSTGGISLQQSSELTHRKQLSIGSIGNCIRQIVQITIDVTSMYHLVVQYQTNDVALSSTVTARWSRYCCIFNRCCFSCSVDDSSIETSSDTLQVKAGGITNACWQVQLQTINLQVQ